MEYLAFEMTQNDLDYTFVIECDYSINCVCEMFSFELLFKSVTTKSFTFHIRSMFIFLPLFE